MQTWYNVKNKALKKRVQVGLNLRLDQSSSILWSEDIV